MILSTRRFNSIFRTPIGICELVSSSGLQADCKEIAGRLQTDISFLLTQSIKKTLTFLGFKKRCSNLIGHLLVELDIKRQNFGLLWAKFCDFIPLFQTHSIVELLHRYHQ